MFPSAHLDSFARDHLPPPGSWPELLFELPELRFPARLNCAAEVLDRNAGGERGDWPAILAPGLAWSYRELQAQANRVARVLIEDLGLAPGNRVLLRAPNHPMFAACWFAALKAGAVVVPTMPLLRARELAQIVQKAQISHALCDARLAAELEAARAHCPTLRAVAYFNGAPAADQALERLAAAKPAQFDNLATAADDVALIAFTSGTTGVPKGTMHFHRDVLATCLGFPVRVLEQRPGEIVAGSPSLAFTYGLGGLLHFPLYHGAAALLLEQNTPEALLEAVGRWRVNVLYSGPTLYRAMAALARNYDLSSLRACVSAGEALRIATRNAWEQASGVPIIDGIGCSELLYIFIAAAGCDVRPGAVGKSLPGYRAAVLDDEGKPCPPGVLGRLAVKGPTGCRYLADPRQANYVQGGWNLTGDAFMTDADGYFYYRARADDMIVSSGYNISAEEVESVLLAHPGVADCAVVGWPDEARGQLVKAYVVPATGQPADAGFAGELQAFVKQHIAPYKYPRAVEFLAGLPRTETGKLQRHKLRAPQNAGSVAA